MLHHLSDGHVSPHAIQTAADPVPDSLAQVHPRYIAGLPEVNHSMSPRGPGKPPHQTSERQERAICHGHQRRPRRRETRPACSHLAGRITDCVCRLSERPLPCLLHVCSDVPVPRDSTRQRTALRLGPLRISCQRSSTKRLVDCVNRICEQRTLNPRVQRHWSSPLVTSLNLPAEERFKPRHAAGAARPWPSVERRRCTPTTTTVHTDRRNCAHRPSL